MEIISEKECDTNTHANKHACIIYMDNCMDKTCGVIYQKLNQCPENHINVHNQRYLNANRSLSALSKTYIFLNLKHSATTNFVLILPSTHSRTHTHPHIQNKSVARSSTGAWLRKSSVFRLGCFEFQRGVHERKPAQGECPRIHGSAQCEDNLGLMEKVGSKD